MKKLLALLIALTFALSLPMGVMAEAVEEEAYEEVEAKEYKWKDVKKVIKESDISGRVVTFDEVAVQIWLPDEYEDVLEDADREEGYIGFFMIDDGSGVVSVTYEDSEYTEIEDYINDLVEAGYDDAEFVLVNGLAAAEYTIPSEEDEEAVYWCEDFLTETGKIVSFTIYPVTTDENIMTLTYMLISSIQEEQE